jgi:predicted HicB family RNase H-like nuclease
MKTFCSLARGLYMFYPFFYNLKFTFTHYIYTHTRDPVHLFFSGCLTLLLVWLMTNKIKLEWLKIKKKTEFLTYLMSSLRMQGEEMRRRSSGRLNARISPILVRPSRAYWASSEPDPVRRIAAARLSIEPSWAVSLHLQKGFSVGRVNVCGQIQYS